MGRTKNGKVINNIILITRLKRRGKKIVVGLFGFCQIKNLVKTLNRKCNLQNNLFSIFLSHLTSPIVSIVIPQVVEGLKETKITKLKD